MALVVRISLPGYDALTDTNLDHFALYGDTDNVLIKEFARGSVTVPANTTPYSIAHNLGYVPLFLVYVYDTGSVFNPNKWKLLAHNFAGASVPPFIALSDTANLMIYNYVASPTQFKYYIFYDNVVGGNSATITESKQVFKVTRPGYDALTEKNPNNYIFHSDLNTFKILKEGNATINYTGVGDYTVAHGLTLANPASYMIYMKFPDGKSAVLPGKGVIYSYDSTFWVGDSYIDTTNIGMHISGTGTGIPLYVKYYIFETPLT